MVSFPRVSSPKASILLFSLPYVLHASPILFWSPLLFGEEYRSLSSTLCGLQSLVTPFFLDRMPHENLCLSNLFHTGERKPEQLSKGLRIIRIRMWYTQRMKLWFGLNQNPVAVFCGHRFEISVPVSSKNFNQLINNYWWKTLWHRVAFVAVFLEFVTVKWSPVLLLRNYIASSW